MYNKTSQQLVYDLVVETTGTAAPLAELVFGVPEAFVPYTAEALAPDTRVKVTSTKQSGRVTLTYRRYNLSHVDASLGAPALPVVTLPFTVWQILPELNAHYGLALVEADVLNTEFTVAADTYPVQAAPESLAWTGVLSPALGLSLASAFTTTELSGFTPRT